MSWRSNYLKTPDEYLAAGRPEVCQRCGVDAKGNYYVTCADTDWGGNRHSHADACRPKRYADDLCARCEEVLAADEEARP